MNERIQRLRDESFYAHPSICIERAVLTTEFYREHDGKLPMPVLRASNFKYICENKTLYIGPDELIVAERGSKPKAVSTFPELIRSPLLKKAASAGGISRWPLSKPVQSDLLP